MKRNGFTLIEILVALAITGILSLGILSLVVIMTQNRLVVWRNFLSVEEANSNVSTLVREIRNLRPADSGSYPLEKAWDQEIVFYSDIDFDGQSEKVRYTLSGNQLTKGVIEPVGYPATYPPGNEKVKVVAENIRNGAAPIFYYYNGDWPQDTINNPLPTPSRLSETKLMKVHLELNTEDSPDKNFSLESYVQLRMLKQNL
jgi:prepilin-type N-terminal cleavage/methylation domain-containing protein